MTTVLLASLLGSLWTVAAALDAPPSSYLLAWFGIVLAATDLRHHRLPDALTLPLGAALLLLQFHRLGAAATTAAIFGGAHLAVRKWRPRLMGGGDVKLAAALGTTLTLPLLLPATIVSSAVTLTIAALKRSRKVPHGPGLLAATWALTTL